MNETNLFLTLSIDPASSTSSYQQLIDQFKGMIASGNLTTGQKVPSSRELAKSLDISRTTTIKSYDILISEGFLIAKPKKGIFVAESLPKLELSQEEESEVDSFTLTSVMENIKPIRLDAGADVDMFPNKEWAASMRRSWLNPDEKVMLGKYSTGLPELKQRVVSYLKDLRGLECEEDQIFITSGNRDSLSLLSHALIDQKKLAQQQVWIENPGFQPISNFFNWLGVDIAPLNIDEEGVELPNVNDSKSGLSHIALITPNRQYPLGTVMSSTRRQEWLSLLASVSESGKKMWLIEDDFDNEFLYQGRMGVPLMNLDVSDSTFFVGSFSKVLFRGIRLGFIIAPKTQVDRIITSQKQLGGTASLPMQAVLADFMKTGNFAAHLRRMRRNYLDKRNFIISLMCKQLSLYFTHQKPSGGMHVLLYFKNHWIKRHESLIPVKSGSMDQLLDVHIAMCMKRRHITVTPLSSHYFSSTAYKSDGEKATVRAQQGFVIGFSQNSKEILKMALEVLMQQVRNHFL